VVRQAVAEVCGLPVLGAVPRLGEQLFPERHLGLVPPQEHDQVPRAIQQAAGAALRYIDLDALERIARQAPPLAAPGEGPAAEEGPKPAAVRIGVFRDAAFQFYYPENLEALVREGAQLVEVSPLGDRQLPEVDALYIGGGFPETAGLAVAENQPFLRSLRRAVEQGLPVYAECGGAVFLGESLVVEERHYPMAAVLPVVFAFGTKRLGHGYTILETVEQNPFFPVGATLRGHEFHYTYMQPSDRKDLVFAFRVRRGYAFDGQWDGLCRGNVLACYTHLHALGAESWAPSLVRAAAGFRSRRGTK
jgi:cobyrinic acid a,c-diamide synthase